MDAKFARRSLLWAVLLLTPSVYGGTLQVPSPAYSTIMDAVADAVDGDVVCVGPGFWSEYIDFLGKAITITSTAGPNMTFLQGANPGQPGSVVTCRTGEGSDSVLEGFHISGGGGTPSAGGPLQGVGMFNDGTSPTVINCVFMDLVANGEVNGGGMANIGASPTIIDCTFQECQATRGGAMYNDAGSAPVISNTTFLINAVESDPPGTANGGQGGAIFSENGSSPQLDRCTFEQNFAFGGVGGAVYSTGSDADSTGVFVNSLFIFNTADQGASIFNEAGQLTVTNCTFTENTSNSAVDPGTCIYSEAPVTATNNIFWDNAPSNSPFGGNTTDFTVTYCDVEGGWPGPTNFNLAPNFAAGGYTLGIGSPCIDSGNDFADIDVVSAGVQNIPLLDRAGADRFQDDPGTLNTGVGDPPVDRGCYERDGIPGNPYDTGASFIRGDASGDGTFNGLTDGLYVLAFGFTMGPQPPCMEAADADGNGIINALVDGLYVLAHQFTQGPPPPPPYPDCGTDPGGDLGCEGDPTGAGCP